MDAIATKAHNSDRVNLVLNTEFNTGFWLIQKEDEPDFYFSTSHNWTTDSFNRKEFWYYHHAMNMANKRNFEVINTSEIVYDIIDDDLIISMNGLPIETVHEIKSQKQASEYLKMNYAYQIEEIN